MPFHDGDQELETLDLSAIDHCVVGAGAAGLLVALRLAQKGRRVLLVESGAFEPDERRQRLNEVEETGRPFGNAVWTRKRIMGGTTTAWGGQTLPFTPSDFTPRPGVRAAGWPVTYDEVAAYYPEADKYTGVLDVPYGERLAEAFGEPSPFDSDLILPLHSKWLPQPDLFKRHRRALKKAVTVLYNCQLLKIDLDAAGGVKTVRLGNFKGLRRELPIASVVLCQGGIESVRTLLLNDHQRPAGLGGEGGWLGRGLMEHPCAPIGTLHVADERRTQAVLTTRQNNWLRFSRLLSASPVWCEREGRLAVTASVMWLCADGEWGPLTHLRAFVRRPSLRHVAGMVTQLPQLAAGLHALLLKGRVFKPGAGAMVVGAVEQAADSSSYIALAKSTDEFGLRRAKVNWSIGDDCWRSLAAYSQVLKAEFERTGLGRLELDPGVQADAPYRSATLTDVNHHMGGARMSASAAEGVVDRDLQVWGAKNLYVCSAAVFPTGFHSNPTLTVMALALRLADKLASEAKPQLG